MSRPLLRDYRLYAAIAALALLAAVPVSPHGLTGMALGLSSGTFGAFALWQLILLVGKMATSGAGHRFGSLLTIVAFFAKLPLYMFCGMLASRLGHGAFGCFLAGVVLVYFCLVTWAASGP